MAGKCVYWRGGWECFCAHLCGHRLGDPAQAAVQSRPLAGRDLLRSGRQTLALLEIVCNSREKEKNEIG